MRIVVRNAVAAVYAPAVVHLGGQSFGRDWPPRARTLGTTLKHAPLIDVLKYPTDSQNSNRSSSQIDRVAEQ
jgi:hypothetical protein